jgi:hypothetical protein
VSKRNPEKFDRPGDSTGPNVYRKGESGSCERGLWSAERGTSSFLTSEVNADLEADRYMKLGTRMGKSLRMKAKSGELRLVEEPH